MNKRTRITNPFRYLLSTGLLLAGLGLMHSARPALAATSQVPGNYKLPGTSEAANGIEFKLSEANGVYTVYMRPNATPSSPNATVSAQVTIKAPHGADAAAFSPSELTALVAGTSWEQSSRNDAPAEAPGSDYVSFSVDFPAGELQTFNWAAGTELPVFSFKAAPGARLMDGCDVFAAPNSVSASVGNEVTVVGLGAEGRSVYIGNYDQTLDCPAQADAVSAVSVTAVSGASLVKGGDLVNYTFNIANKGLRTAQNLSLKVTQMGLADMQSGSNSFDAANPWLLANQSATWHLGKLAPNAQGNVVVTMLAPRSNSTLTTKVSVAATNDNSAFDNDAEVVVVVQAFAPTDTGHRTFLPMIMR